jgi:hypothetical protein
MKTTQLPQIYPSEWSNIVNLENLDVLEFRNLLHFKNYVSKLSQKDDNKCGVTYKQAVSDLQKGTSLFDSKTYHTIRNLVRSNLLKRGLLTQEVYENYKYATDGIVVDYDMGKYAAGEPDCIITPTMQYVDFFYELYVNISYRSRITDETIATNMNKMLATIEELQRQHINIKISLVFPAHQSNGTNDFLSIIPLFSHREFKTAEVMSSVLNNRLLRKFYFAILEDFYKSNLTEGYGSELKLNKTMNLADEFDEINFFTNIMTTAKEG